jgi:hypothetical protein
MDSLDGTIEVIAKPKKIFHNSIEFGRVSILASTIQQQS